MLEIKVGDIFNETLNRRCMIVHGCNAQGVMGSGVAKIVKDLYPHAFLSYKQRHKRVGLRVGDVVIADPFGNEGKPVVANAITQEFYGRDGKQYVNYDGVVVAMMAIADFAREKDLEVNLPMIGGGRGGGDVKRLTAIFQAAFHANKATLWLKEE